MRTGAQGLRLSEIPKLSENLRELSRLGIVDRAGRSALRRWVEDIGPVFDECKFLAAWVSQGRRVGQSTMFTTIRSRGVGSNDLYDEDVVRVPDSNALAVIDPFISLARRGSWAGIKQAEIGQSPPADESLE